MTSLTLLSHNVYESEKQILKRVGTTGTIMRSRFATLILVCFSFKLAACECLDSKCEVLSSPVSDSVCMVKCNISRGFSVVVQINGHYTFTTCREGIIESTGQCVIRNMDEHVVGVKFNQSFTGNITMVTLDPNNAYCSRICNLPISQNCVPHDADCLVNNLHMAPATTATVTVKDQNLVSRSSIQHPVLATPAPGPSESVNYNGKSHSV
jgi:hypothetical protein